MGTRGQGRKAGPIELVLYSRPGCHLCDEMKGLIAQVLGDFEASLREVDVSTDPALEADYGEQIPVLLVDGKKAFKYRTTRDALRERLRRARNPEAC